METQGKGVTSLLKKVVCACVYVCVWGGGGREVRARVCVCACVLPRYLSPVVDILIILSGMFCTRDKKK